MFFKSLRNFLRCFFCREFCNVKYRIGERRYYSGYGYGSLGCPKYMKKHIPYYGMTVKEIREHMKKNCKRGRKTLNSKLPEVQVVFYTYVLRSLLFKKEAPI